MPTNILVIGDKRAGKTELARRLVQDTYDGQRQPTPATYSIKHNDEVTFWDTSSNYSRCLNEFCNVHSMWSRLNLSKAAVVLICVDLSQLSFEISSLSIWHRLAELHSPDARIIVVSTKSDIERKRTLDDLSEMVSSPAEFVECSAKTGDGIPELKAMLPMVSEAEEQPTRGCCVS